MAENKQLVEDVKKRFNLICGYDATCGLNEQTLLSNTVEEEDDQEDPNAAQDPSMGGDPNAMGGDPNAMGGAPADPSMGGGPNAMGGDPNAMGGAPADPSMGGDPNAAAPPEGFNPQVASMGDPSMGGGDMEQPGDEVLDVTDITDAQEDTEKDVRQLSDKVDKMFELFGEFKEMLRANNEKVDKIEELKAEMERRNPTPMEKLSMQASKSYPFNVTPDEFWKEKEATSNYSLEDDNNGKDMGQYVITKNDVEGNVDWKSIADSLDDPSFIMDPSLDKLLKF